MVAFYDTSVLYPVFDTLWSDVKDSPSLLNGIDRALTKRPVETDLDSRMVWDRLQRVSETAWDYRGPEAQIRLREEIESALRVGEWMRAIELIDRYVAEGWTYRSKTSQEHDLVILAQLRVNSHFEMRDFKKATAIASEILDRFRDNRDTFILLRSAMILYRKSAAHFELHDFRNAMSSAGELVNWFGKYNHPQFQQFVGAGLLLTAEIKKNLGEYETAVSILDDILYRYRGEDAAELQRIVARALTQKAFIARMELRDDETAFAALDEVIGGFRTTTDIHIKRLVIDAFMNRAFMKGSMDDFVGEIESYNELIGLVGGTGESDTEPHVVPLALVFKSMSLIESGRIEEADKTCEELEEKLDLLRGELKAGIESQTRYVRAIAMMARGETANAIDAFRSAYAMFPATHQVPVGCMIRLGIHFIAAGASEREVAKILSGDRTKAGALGPLIVALRQRSGESVRAPTEVLKVAADIRKRISASELKVRP